MGAALTSIAVEERDLGALRGAELICSKGPLKLWRVKGWLVSYCQIAYHPHPDHASGNNYLCICQFNKGQDSLAVQQFDQICEKVRPFLADDYPLTAAQLTRLLQCLHDESAGPGLTAAHLAVHANLDGLLSRKNFQLDLEATGALTFGQQVVRRNVKT